MTAFEITAPEGQYVFHNGARGIKSDTVYYLDECDNEYVRNTLINHDGYNPNIMVSRIKRK